MKEKRREMDESKITGFFDDGTEFNGELKFKGTFRVDGFFHGRIESESHLVIGERGKVEAEVHVANVLINGEFRGDMIASDRVEVQSRGRVFGSIQTPKLIIEEGAYLEANCHTTEPQPPNNDLKKILEQ